MAATTPGEDRPAAGAPRPGQRRNTSGITDQQAEDVTKGDRPIAKKQPTMKRNLGSKMPERPPQRPRFSLAGNETLQSKGQSYIDPEYFNYNPRYQKQEPAPIFGLAGTLPRVVRAGQRKGRAPGAEGVVRDEKAEVPEPGSTEIAPELGMIDDQREDVGKERIINGSRPEEERGYGHNIPTPHREASASSIRRGGGTPAEERGNPLDRWAPNNTNNSGDPAGDGKPLESVQEEPATRLYSRETQNQDAYDVDLENGKVDSLETEEDDYEHQAWEAEEWEQHNGWASLREKLREPLAETLATMLAVLIGVCANLAVLTSADEAGDYQTSTWAWGFGTMVGIYIAGGISGGHLNPAISLMLCLYRGFPARKAAIYIVAQMLGAYFAGLIAYGIYRDAIVSFNTNQAVASSRSPDAVSLFEGGTGIAFFTQPAEFNHAGSSFANEFVATAILACAILALGDDSNAPPGAGMHALIVGFVITVLVMAFGYNTGACLNPARDFGPRLAAVTVGYSGKVFTIRNGWWFWGGWGATISGALVGGFLYDFAIFVGGESPINYPRAKRRDKKQNVKRKVKRNWIGLKDKRKEIIDKNG